MTSRTSLKPRRVVLAAVFILTLLGIGVLLLSMSLIHHANMASVAERAIPKTGAEDNTFIPWLVVLLLITAAVLLWKHIEKIFLAALAILILFFLYNCGMESRVRWKNTQSHSVARSPAGHTNPSPQPAAKQPTWKTFEIPKDGLKIHLGEVWRDKPIGGKITITTPNGRVLRDEPGANKNYGLQPEGDYIFRADPPGEKRQVEIKSIW